MELLKELPYDECRRLLGQETVGRVAICMPEGPQIVPVNYVVEDESIVFRTAPFSVLGSHADGARLAMEVDRLEHEERRGWSVVASGVGRMIEDTFEVAGLRLHDGPQPWAGGARPMHVRLTWYHLTGRSVGNHSDRAGGTARALSGPGRP